MAINKTDKVLNVPTLRFPGFTDKWEKKRVGDIAKLSKGAGISKDDRSISGVPCILYGELYTTYNSEIINKVVSKTELPLDNLVQSEGNDVIIPSSGESAIDISTARCITTSGILLGGDLNIIRLKNDDGRFLSYQLNGVRKLDIAKVAQGVSVVHLYGDALKSISVSLPHIDEQKKIADFLSLLDERIALQSKLIDRLKSLMDGIIDKVTALTPNISIRDCLDCYSSTLQECETEEQGTYPVYGANGVCGYLDYATISAPAILIVKDGSGVGNVSYANGDCSVVGTLNYLQPKKDVSAKFLYFVLKRFNFQPYKTGMAIPHIYFKAYSKTRIFCPDYEEQTRMAASLSRIEDKIALEERLLCLQKEQKHYLLSAMFI